MTELEVYKDIIRCCFTLRTNMNDSFHWATADVGEIEADDIEKILPIYQECGSDTLTAYEAIVRGYDPQSSLLASYKDKGASYWKAKKLLEPLAASGTILWERWYDLEEDRKDLEFFGSKITWSQFESIKYRRLLMSNKPGYDGNCIIQVAKLSTGEFAVGRSITEARERLTRKYLLLVKGIKT